MAKKKECSRDFESPSHPSRTCKFKLGSGEIELLDSGLEAVQALMSAQDSSYEKQLLSVVEKIGLANALKRIWQWQDPQICEEFIRNWNSKEKKTSVFGVQIDADVGTFLPATGLNGSNIHSPTIMDATDCCKSWKYGEICGAERGRWGKPGLRVCDLRNEIIRCLLVLLNKTLWMGSKDAFGLPKAFVYLLVEALEGNALGWGLCVHERFLCVMGSFQSCHRANTQYMQTLAGPLMCFLYARARDKARNDVSQISRAEFHHSSGREKREEGLPAVDEVYEEKPSVQLGAKVEPPCPSNNSMRKRPHEGDKGFGCAASVLPTQASCASADLLQGSRASVPPSTPDHPSKRPCRSRCSDIGTDSSWMGFQEFVELTAKVGELTEHLKRREKQVSDLLLSKEEWKEEMDRKKNEISRLQQAEAEFSTCYERLEGLYAQEVKKVRELTEDTKNQQKVIYQLTVAEAEYKKKVTKLERLYADEQQHVKECLQLHFTSAAAEDEVAELKERVKVLTDQCRETARRESFLELQLADLRRRWDLEFPLRKEGT